MPVTDLPILNPVSACPRPGIARNASFSGGAACAGVSLCCRDAGGFLRSRGSRGGVQGQSVRLLSSRDNREGPATGQGATGTN